MRPAPSLVVPLSDGRGERLAVAGLASAGAASAMAWTLSWWPQWADRSAALPAWAVIGASLLAASAAAGFLLRSSPWPARWLRFDGVRWSIGAVPGFDGAESSDAARSEGGDADVMVDLGSWMLLRLRPSQGRTCWHAASERSAGASWARLRATLYLYRGGPGQGPAAGA